MERMQIDQGFAEGKTPSELAQAGLSSAIEPKVLSWAHWRYLVLPVNSIQGVFVVTVPRV